MAKPKVSKNEKLIKEWNYSKNTLDPEDLTCGSDKKVWWICNKKHEWKASVNNRSNGTGCPYCAGKIPTKENNLFVKSPNTCKEWNYSRNSLGPDNFTVKSNKKVWWICDKKHEWEETIYRRVSGYNCPYCSGKRVCNDNCLSTVNPELAKEWSSKNKLRSYEVTSRSNKKVWWICKNGHEWKETVDNRSHNYNCPYCSGRRVCDDNCLKVTNKKLCEEWNCKKNKNITTEDVTKSSSKEVWWVCKNGHEWKTTIRNRNIGRGCPYCAGKIPTKENNLLVKNPILCREWSDKNKFSPKEILPNSGKKVWWICKNGHEWMASPNNRNYGAGCPHCSKVISKKCLIWLKPLKVMPEHKIVIGGNKYYVDGFDYKTNTVYEYLGIYWHGDPRRYNPLEINKKKNVSFGDLLIYTAFRFNILCSNGYRIVYRWEVENVDKVYVPVNVDDILKESIRIYIHSKNVDILQVGTEEQHYG